MEVLWSGFMMLLPLPMALITAALVWLALTATHAVFSVGPLAVAAGGPLDRSFSRSPRGGLGDDVIQLLPGLRA